MSRTIRPIGDGEHEDNEFQMDTKTRITEIVSPSYKYLKAESVEVFHV